MMSMRAKHRPSQTSVSGPSRYDRMAAPGHITNMNSSVNWSEFMEERERKGGNQLPAIPSGSSLNNSFRKRVPPSTADMGASDRFTILPEIEGIDIDKELRESLSGPLKDVSRQRLRAIKISFRRLSNMDNRVSTKDVLVVLGEHNVKITNRTYQMIVRKFETDRGMDVDGLWKYMAEAQARTGRDSTQAINQNKQTAAQPLQQLDTEDIALVASINKALKSSNEYDLEEMRTVCQMRDISRHGLLPRKMFRRICLDQHIPLGASLMRTMLKRCDDEKNGLISWPEFLMLLEKGVNFDPEQHKTKKRVPSAIYRPNLSHKKPPSPKSPALLSPNDAKSKEGKDARKISDKPKPKSSGVSTSKEAAPKGDSLDGRQPESELRENANTLAVPVESGSKSQEPPTGQDTKAKDGSEPLKVGSKMPAKSPDVSRKKRSLKDPKESGKLNLSREKKDEDAISVKSLPAPRKNKVITWNDPITVPLKADESPANTEQVQSSKVNESETCKSPLPSDKLELIEPGDASNKPSVDNESKNEEPVQSEPSLDFDRTQDTGSQSGDKINSSDSFVDPTEEEYLKRQQQKINCVGSQVTLNEPSLENSSSRSGQKEEINPNPPVNPDVKDDPKLHGEDKSDAVSVAPSEKVDIHLPEVEVAESVTNDQQDFEGSETSSVHDRDDTDTQSVVSLVLPTKPKALTPSMVSEKKMRAVYGKNPRRQLTPLAKKQDRERRTPTGRTTNTGKSSLKKKSTEVKLPKMKSSRSLSAKGETKVKKKSTTESVASTSAVDLSEPLPREPDADTRSIVSRSSLDSQENVLLKSQSCTSLATVGDGLADDGDFEQHSQDNVLSKSHSSSSLTPSVDQPPDDGDSLSQHLQEVEKANDPTQEGAPSPIPALSDEDPKEGAELPPAREEDGEKATFTIRGQEVSYYKPDTYVGKEPLTDGPSQTLELDWVYGYRGNDCRCNMYIVEDGVLAYFIGKTAVLYNTQEHTQRHYTSHTAEIKSLAVHSSNVIIATGQIAGPEESGVQASIHVWSVETLETLYTAGEGYFEKAVLCLSFCKEEDYLVAVDDSDEHTMSLWLSSSGERLADKVLLTEVVCQVAFHPTRPNQLVSIGKEHLCFWKLQKEPYTIEETMIANYETKMKAKYVICLAFHPNGALLTGDSNGTIYLWHKDGNTIVHSITHAHNGPVFWLMYVKNTLISGGRDGIIQTYSLSSKGTDYTGKLQLPQVEGGVRTIQIHRDKMYIGTTLNCILSANISSSGSGPQIAGATINNAPITQGHYDEVRCIVPHPTKKEHFFTAAYDGIVCLYDASLHKAIWKYVVKGINTTCMDISHGGDVIILGAKDGYKGNSLVVLTVGDEEVQETNRIKLGRQPVSSIKFAPGGEIFAASCSDIILILKTVDAGKTIDPLGKCQGHLTAVTGFDWSQDETSGRLLLRSSSLSHEYLCWDIETFQSLDYSADYRNITWRSHNCLSGFTVAGVWGTSEDSRLVNSIDWSEHQGLLTAGTDDGLVSLYKYPCTNQQAASRSVHAHSKTVACVRFLSSGKLLLSAGGSDCTTTQWTVQGEASS